MKTITQYQAADGSIFSSAAECSAHEVLCLKVAEIMCDMGERPSGPGCAFENGQLGYVQHDIETIDSVAERLLELARPLLPAWDRQLVWKNGVHWSHPARAMDDAPGPLSRAWHRIACTDEQGREFGQMFYRNNPDKCAPVCCLDLRRSA